MSVKRKVIIGIVIAIILVGVILGILLWHSYSTRFIGKWILVYDSVQGDNLVLDETVYIEFFQYGDYETNNINIETGVYSHLAGGVMRLESISGGYIGIVDFPWETLNIIKPEGSELRELLFKKEDVFYRNIEFYMELYSD